MCNRGIIRVFNLHHVTIHVLLRRGLYHWAMHSIDHFFRMGSSELTSIERGKDVRQWLIILLLPFLPSLWARS